MKRLPGYQVCNEGHVNRPEARRCEEPGCDEAVCLSAAPDHEWRNEFDSITLAEARAELARAVYQCDSCGIWQPITNTHCENCESYSNPLSVLGAVLVRALEYQGFDRDHAALDTAIAALNSLGVACGIHWRTAEGDAE